MTRIRTNLVKNAECENEKCRAKLYRANFFHEVTRQYVEINATCHVCGHTFNVDRKHREQVNV